MKINFLFKCSTVGIGWVGLVKTRDSSKDLWILTCVRLTCPGLISTFHIINQLQVQIKVTWATIYRGVSHSQRPFLFSVFFCFYLYCTKCNFCIIYIVLNVIFVFMVLPLVPFKINFVLLLSLSILWPFCLK